MTVPKPPSREQRGKAYTRTLTQTLLRNEGKITPYVDCMIALGLKYSSDEDWRKSKRILYVTVYRTNQVRWVKIFGEVKAERDKGLYFIRKDYHS